MIFEDRADAARRLAGALARWRGRKPVVLAIPRGAVPIGKIIADALGGELDIVLTRKIGAPGQPELAIGAVGESGWTVIDDSAADLGVSAQYIEREVAAQRALIANRRALYTPARVPIELSGRVAIIVDDGLATGATMVAALHDTRARAPSELVCAVPVASRHAYLRVGEYADTVVCLATPENFRAVGQFYREFQQVTDAEVVAILAAGSPP